MSTAEEKKVPAVLFLCTHNAGRSQMAAGFLRTYGGDGVKVLSAGSSPGPNVNPVAVEAMKEKNIDISQSQPQKWTNEMVEQVDVVVSMGCGDKCPYIPGKRYDDWPLTDPHGQGIETVRVVRDEIEGKIRALMGDLGIYIKDVEAPKTPAKGGCVLM